MPDTFDPFSAEDGGGGDQLFTDAFGGFSDTTFDDATSFDFAATPMSAVMSGEAAMTGTAMSGDSAISFGAGASGSGNEHVGDDDGNDNDDVEFPAFPSPSRRHMIPVNISLHEEMSCVYDGVSNTSSLAIEGIVCIKSSVALEGKGISLTLKDPEQHVDKLSYDASIVSEVGTNADKSTPKNNRFFTATLPDSDLPSHTDVQCIKYSCSGSLVPVPVLVQSKVKVAGQLCRVAIKIRSNPANKHDLSNVAIMMAVPPDLDGETVKMSKRGGVWDKMKRAISWSVQRIKPGETKELQIQLHFDSDWNEGAGESKNDVPIFPVLLRFETKNALLSSVDIELGDPSGDDFVFEEYAMKLTKSFRVMHRKV